MPAIGFIRCPFAVADAASHRRGDQAVVSQAKNEGAVAWRCTWCGASGFGPDGARNKRHLLATVEHDDDATGDPAKAPAKDPRPKPPKATPAPTPTPAPARKKGFALEDL